MFSLILIVCLFVSPIFAQTDVDYYINCPGKKDNIPNMKQAVEIAKRDGYDHNHFYICGVVNITEDLDFTFRVKMFGHSVANSDKNNKNYLKNANHLYQKYESDSVLKADPYQKEAETRRNNMFALMDSIDVGVVSSIIISPNVKLHFRGLTQIHNLGLYSSSDSDPNGWTMNFYLQTGSDVFFFLFGYSNINCSMILTFFLNCF
jgi:hypothetical protein